MREVERLGVFLISQSSQINVCNICYSSIAVTPSPPEPRVARVRWLVHVGYATVVGFVAVIPVVAVPPPSTGTWLRSSISSCSNPLTTSSPASVSLA